MIPNSFLAEWCFQALTQRLTLTRLELWHRFQSVTDEELARQIMPAGFAYIIEDVASNVGEIRTANAGDLGEFALFALGLGSSPLRPEDLTAERRDTLIKMELIALRSASDAPVIADLVATITPNAASSLKWLDDKYGVSELHVAALAKKSRESYSQAPLDTPVES